MQEKPLGRKQRAIQFIELEYAGDNLEGNCFVPINFQLNQDGYFRKSFWVNGKSVLEMFHRFIWRAFHGEIPNGHEVDHVCRNRACCNINHLRCIDGLKHTVHTNQTRYRDRNDKARELWLSKKITGRALADIFDVSEYTAWNWIKDWKKQGFVAPK